MDLSNLKPAAGSTKTKKRIGRGAGSGLGKTAGKGHKGQKARSGGSVKAGFEGGQMPLHRRLPKRGFTPLQRRVFGLVNLQALEGFAANSVVDREVLILSGLIRKNVDAVKILAEGDITKPLTVKAEKFSKAALEKIAAAGGTAEVIG
ncbi:MAG: 50S ribosomal protein L15 [Deltaproteobacteria bacterium]|nr:50S ribosomal protein L15 [Deltaproteobacteria bacterium]